MIASIFVILIYSSGRVCYGAEPSLFAFKDARGRVVQIEGKNGTGKSSFMDVINLALFGQPVKADFSAAGSANEFLYDGMAPNDVASFRLVLCVGGVDHEILRKYSKSEDGGLKPKVFSQGILIA